VPKRPVLDGYGTTTERLEPGTSYIEYPYAALHCPTCREIHTLITLGVSILPKPPVLKARQRVPRGFDSHRPLHSRSMPGNAG
jgi:hypothetical protein